MTDSPGGSGLRAKPNSYLHKACNNCRRRKIRCDGERPVCRRCRLQPPRSLTPCKYSHAPVGGAISPHLEEMVEALQNRIRELEALTGQDPSQVFLLEPYPNRHFPHQRQHSAPELGINEPDIWNNPMRKFGTPSPIESSGGNSYPDHRDSSVQFFATPSPIEEPRELTPTLAEIFFRRFFQHQFFFLNASQFQQSAALPGFLPRGLLAAVELWANHVSANPFADSRYTEDELLARAVHHIARDLAGVETSPQPQYMIYLIQAEVLLSLYYLNCGRLLESNYHRAGATSLSFTAGLHQLGGASSSSQVPLVFSNTDDSIPMDPIRQMEMVDAFWSVVILNNYCVATSDIPSSIPCYTLINTPWPTHVPQIASTVPFFHGNDIAGHAPLTLLAKASIQLERVIAFTARNRALPNPPEPEFWAMEARLETFRRQLPPINPASTTDQLSLVTHALVNVAIIRLLSPRPNNPACNIETETVRAKCLIAASCITARLADSRLSEWEHADPILGVGVETTPFSILTKRRPHTQPLLAVVAELLIANISYTSQAAADLQTILSAMQTLARRSPLIKQHLALTEQRYPSVHGQPTFVFGHSPL